MDLYRDKKSEKKMMKLVLIGAINWGLYGIFNENILSKLLSKFNLNYIEKYIYIVIGISALFLYKRDTLLPFLGDTVMPLGIFKESYPENYEVVKTIKLKPNTKVIFWASEPSDKVFDNPWDAYGLNNNSGVTMSDKNGDAIIKVRNPSSYKKPYKLNILKPHIHYRYFKSNNMLSSIETLYL